MRLSFWEHVEELRKTFIRVILTALLASVLAFFFHKQLFAAILEPFGISQLHILSPLEGFACATKVAIWFGILFSSPLWLFFVFKYLVPALNKGEKNLILPFFILSACFTMAGFFFAYTITIPAIIQFFRAFNSSIGADVWSLSQTINFILSLLLAHGMIFELYVILLFLIHLGFLPFARLKKARKGIIVVIFILAAIFTPPDILSQILLAFPMLALFESALLFARFKNSAYPRETFMVPPHEN
jgi:sec-independent protein translocase protein TatC